MEIGFWDGNFLAWGRECDFFNFFSICMGAWEHGDGSMGMGECFFNFLAWGWEHCYFIFLHLDRSNYFCDKCGDGSVGSGSSLAWDRNMIFSTFFAQEWENGDVS